MQYNTDDRPQPNKFLSIQTMPNSSFRSSFQSQGPLSAGMSGRMSGFPHDQPGSANATFGSFGQGTLSGLPWKGPSATGPKR
jgi:translation initiation factor 4E